MRIDFEMTKFEMGFSLLALILIVIWQRFSDFVQVVGLVDFANM